MSSSEFKIFQLALLNSVTTFNKDNAANGGNPLSKTLAEQPTGNFY